MGKNTEYSDTNSIATTNTRQDTDDSVKEPWPFTINPRSDLRASIDLLSLIASVFNLLVMIYLFAFGWTNIPTICIIGSGLSDGILLIDIATRFITSELLN